MSIFQIAWIWTSCIVKVLKIWSNASIGSSFAVVPSKKTFLKVQGNCGHWFVFYYQFYTILIVNRWHPTICKWHFLIKTLNSEKYYCFSCASVFVCLKSKFDEKREPVTPRYRLLPTFYPNLNPSYSRSSLNCKHACTKSKITFKVLWTDDRIVNTKLPKSPQRRKSSYMCISMKIWK